MDDETDSRNIYSVAILVMRGRDWTLEAQAFIAHSHDEARDRGIEWAEEKYPGAHSYHAHACLLTGSDVVAELVRAINERSDSGKELARLAKELDEVRRQTTGEPEPETLFRSPESDKVQ